MNTMTMIVTEIKQTGDMSQANMKRQLYFVLQGKREFIRVPVVRWSVRTNITDDVYIVLDKVFRRIRTKKPTPGTYYVVRDSMGVLYGIIQKLNDTYAYYVPTEYDYGTLLPGTKEDISSWVWLSRDSILYSGYVSWKRGGKPLLAGEREQKERKKTADEWIRREFGD